MNTDPAQNITVFSCDTKVSVDFKVFVFGNFLAGIISHCLSSLKVMELFITGNKEKK